VLGPLQKERSDISDWAKTNNAQYFTHDLVNKTGNKVGDITLEPRINPRDATQQMLHVRGVYGNQGPGQEGFSGTKELLRSIREEYPWATGISGFRVSGGRGQSGKTGEATMYFKGPRFDRAPTGPSTPPNTEWLDETRRRLQELERSPAHTYAPAPSSEDLHAMMQNILRALPPNIPGFADGGIVDRPTVGLLGENGPEAVVPLGPHHQMMPLADRMRAAGVSQSQNIEYRGQGPTAADLISIYMHAMRTGLLGKPQLPPQDTDNPLSQALGVAGIRPHYVPRQGSQASLSGYPSRSLLQ
jgi:hypothetical protein